MSEHKCPECGGPMYRYAARCQRCESNRALQPLLPVYCRLTVVDARVGERLHSMSMIAAQCQCGALLEVRLDHLTSGVTSSCGCFAREKNTTHGQATKGRTPEYNAWVSMNQRCTNYKNPRWKDYGGRGITVCAAWRDSFEAFLSDMGARPSPQHSIDRKDNDGPYTPDNCRWATRAEQMSNRRPAARLERVTVNGAIFYRGPSLLTGDEVVGVITGIDGQSANKKTGPMCQTWVLRSDLPPMEAKRRNLDDAICGDCKLRGRDGKDSGCYLPVWQAPHQVWKSLCRYPVVNWSELQAVVEGRSLRLCAYGDPAALPFDVWRTMLVTAAGWVAYSHQWKICDQRLKAIAMASVDCEDEYISASLRGWRTFRIRRTVHAPLFVGAEFACPASDEMDHRTTCQRCQLCRGTSSRARSVAIAAHGKPSSLRAFGIKVPFFINRGAAEVVK